MVLNQVNMALVKRLSPILLRLFILILQVLTTLDDVNNVFCSVLEIPNMRGLYVVRYASVPAGRHQVEASFVNMLIHNGILA